MESEKGVLIYGETTGGELGRITRELLGIGRKLADELGEELGVLLMTGEGAGPAAEAIAYGADRVYVIAHPSAEAYQADAHVPCVLEVLRTAPPKIFLLGNTEIGQDLAPRLAFRLKTGLVTDCINLSIHPETRRLIQTKQVYGGKVLADFECDTFPQMAAVRPKTMAEADRDESRTGDVIVIDVELDEARIRTKTLETVTEESEGLNLEDADIIVSGGRGIGGEKGFQELEALAGALKNAVVGASRPPCDEGWISSRNQVGITGKIVAPRIYLAVGISGASQHVTGCSGSQTIIAINKDKNAPIFKFARFGLVGDWKETLPAFTRKIKELT